MEYKGYEIKTLYDPDANEFCIGVAKDNAIIYETECWHFNQDPDFDISDAKIEDVKKMIDNGDIK